MEFVNNGLVNVEVNVVDIGFDRGVDIEVTDLPLPGEPSSGMPPVGFRCQVEGFRLL